MSVISNIFSKGASELVEKVGDAIDKNVTSKEEKGKLKNKFADIVQYYETKAQEELTERMRIDSASDSWLPKNIRPTLLIFLTVVVAIFAGLDGNVSSFVVKSEYIELFKTLLVTAFMFYYGSRGGEKITKLIGEYGIKVKNKKK